MKTQKAKLAHQPSGTLFKQTTLPILSLAIWLNVGSSLQAAELGPEEGLKRLSENVVTSSKNRDEYNKALTTVGQNINALDSASLNLQQQKNKLSQHILENQATLGVYDKKLQELERQRVEEERKKNEELAKIAQLEKSLAQLRELQKSRQDRLQKLTLDKTTLEKSKQQGNALQLTLADETKRIDQRLDELKKEVMPWKDKQKSYQKEAARWSSEVDRHQKMETEVKLLIDSEG